MSFAPRPPPLFGAKDDHMRDIDFAGEKLAIKSCPWSLVVYEDQFGRDLSMDFQAMSTSFAQTGRIDLAGLSRVIWCLARTANPSLSDYRAWMESLPDDALDGVALDQSDDGLWGQVSLDYMQAFFRAALGGQKAGARRGRSQGKDS